MSKDSSQSRKVNAVVNSMDILRELGRAGKPVGVHAMASKLGLPVSTVHRLLSSLIETEFVAKVPETSEYTLGRSCLELLSDMVRQFDVRRSLRPVMERLSELTQETIHLTVAVHSQIMDVDVIDSLHSVGVRASIGSILPIHATAVGKIFLAYSDTFHSALMRGEIPLIPMTFNTITDLALLLDEIDKVQRQGYSINLGGRTEQTAGAAVPIFGLNGELVAALGVSGPISRFQTNEDLEQLAHLIMAEIKNYIVSSRTRY